MSAADSYRNALRFLAYSMSLCERSTEGALAEELRRAGFVGTDSEVLNTVLSIPDFQSKMVAQEQFRKSADFLATYEWRKLRMEVLTAFGPRCQCCGAAPEDGVVINVDHILPRKTNPWLALDSDNLQVLCNDCNHGKGNWDTTDWRPGCFADAYIAH